MLDEPVLLDEPPSPGPPSGGGLHGPQVPCVLPFGATQASPTQQSASIVHGPQEGTHAAW